ncbi:beta-galactosidase [Streptomyces formicae]|uniref:Beta-galactosidase n=1 Tax=Streptomyces formicae TaxID=1616117 RepID=A0ABY3WHV1_9ACTN|nr:beta-galactosidase [Streptomyces formicae]UNM12148.1 beta-galactosidase [Streptomyces formicae]
MPIEVRDGVAVTDGNAEVLVTADYPYYRDDASVWEERLRALRDTTGVRVVTSYIPWRHHQPRADAAPDFTGRTHPSRNVVRYFEICAALGLRVIAKPGPFIHAETNYGGLPDWICPTADPTVEAMLDANGEPVRWSGSRLDADGRIENWPLPAPTGAAFHAKVTEWLRAVGKEVLAASVAPTGPVVMVQIANEGLFTDGSLPLWSYDYSEPALAFFRGRLRAWYGDDLDAYNRLHATGHGTWEEIEPPREWTDPGTPQQMQGYADWGRFHADHLTEAYHSWTEALGPDAPVVVNLNPPAEHHHSFDAWLARVRPEQWQGIHYGFTNWMGVVSANPDSQARYLLAAKRAPGPNLEENWGFSELYDRAYADAATSFHQTLLALAAGATGFNVYTGVATAGWGDELDILHAPPYPDCPPVNADGTPGPKADVVRMLAEFFEEHGAEFLECEPVTGGAFGLYVPYAAVAAWAPQDATDTPQCGRTLRAFHDHMRAHGLDYQVLDLEHATPDDLARHAELTVPGGPFMHAAVQDLLAAYVGGGGRLTVRGTIPDLDERLAPCTALAEALVEPAPVPDTPRSVAEVRVVRGRADAFLRVHPDRPVGYLTVLTQSDNEGPVVLELSYGTATHTVEVTTAAGGAAVLRITDGSTLDDFLVKGVNTFLDSTVPAACALDGQSHQAVAPADLVRIRGVLRTVRSTDPAAT